MKKMLLVLLGLIPFIANAGIYVEPYAGYVKGDGDFSWDGVSAEGDGDYSGTVFGGRAGGSFLGLIAGFEFSKEFVTDDTEFTDMGVFVGYKFPKVIPFLGKVWGTYFFDSEIKDDSDSLDGTGMAFGIGFNPIPLPVPFIDLHINFEYRTRELEHDYGELGKLKCDDKQYVISVSLPIDI